LIPGFHSFQSRTQSHASGCSGRQQRHGFTRAETRHYSGVHRALNFSLRQGATVDRDVIDRTLEEETARALADCSTSGRNDLRGRDRAAQTPVVQDTIDVNVQCSCRRIVNTCDVVPAIQPILRPAIPLGVIRAASTSNSDRKGALPGVRTDLQLPAGGVIGPGNDLSIVPRVAFDRNPGAPCHAASGL
jgi:hypothetical protein